jgi:hypothetical protein
MNIFYFSIVGNRIYLNPASSRWTILNYHSASNWRKIIRSVLTLNIISSLFKQRICSDELQFVRSPFLSCFDYLCLLTLPVVVVLLGFSYFSSATPPDLVMLIRCDIWFEIPSFTHPLEVVMLFGLIYGLKFLPLLTPLRGSNAVRFDIWFEIPSFTHPLEVVLLIRFVIWFEIPSFTHPLEVVTLFGLLYGLKFLPLLTPLEVVMLIQFDIWFEIPSFTHPLEVVMLFGLLYGLKFLHLLTPLEVVMLIRFDIWFEIPSFTHPPRGSNAVRFVIWFEIPSFTHPLEVVMLFGPENFEGDYYCHSLYILLEFKAFQKKYFLKLQVFQGLGIGFPSRSSNLYDPAPAGDITLYGPSQFGPSFPSFGLRVFAITFLRTKSPIRNTLWLMFLSCSLFIRC